MESNKKSPKRIVFWVVIIGAITTQIFFGDDLKSKYFSIIDRSRLAHYQNATQITQEEFEKIKSESIVLDQAKEVEAIPNLKEYLISNRMVRASAQGGIDMYRLKLIFDDPKGMYYLHDELDFGLDDVNIKKFSKDFHSVSFAGFPYDKRWYATGGLACFSCGCSCYMKKHLMVANDRFYVSVSGKDFAIRPEQQGIYFLQGKDWNRLTPKVEGDFKITHKGCSIYYQAQSQYYKLDTCSR